MNAVDRAVIEAVVNDERLCKIFLQRLVERCSIELIKPVTTMTHEEMKKSAYEVISLIDAQNAD